MEPTRNRLPWLVLTALAALLAPLLLVAPAASARPLLDHLDLPDGFQPEGITVGRGAVAYLGSRADGDLYRLNLRTGEVTRISEGPGTPSVGLKFEHRRRLLYVAGGTSGTARVVDARTGDVLADYALATDGAPTFVNDVVLTRDAAWFTDSARAQLYRVPLGGDPDAAVRTVALGGDWVQAPDVNNANGIVTTPDRTALLVVNSADGRLYRVDPGTGDATVVDLGGASLANGDGLLREGTRLYAVLNRLNTIAVLTLTADGTSASYQRAITSPDFDVPTTVARFGRSLYLPNARFTDPAPEPKDYWVTRVTDRR